MESINYEEELKRLYDIAVEQKDVSWAVELLKMLTGKEGKAVDLEKVVLLILKILQNQCTHEFLPNDPEGRTVGDLDGKCRICGLERRRNFKAPE